jgi:hypothetical protein
MRAFITSVFAASAAFVAAVPVAQPAPVVPRGWHNYSDPALSKRTDTQVIEQCTVPGQIALTFDGSLRSLPSFPVY